MCNEDILSAASLACCCLSSSVIGVVSCGRKGREGKERKAGIKASQARPGQTQTERTPLDMERLWLG